MQVIFHETVRNDFNVELIGRWQKLPSDQIYVVSAGEAPAALKRAHRQENTGGAEVDIVAKARWPAMPHVCGCARPDPFARLKPSRYVCPIRAQAFAYDSDVARSAS
jgi:hypothetical protein